MWLRLINILMIISAYTKKKDVVILKAFVIIIWRTEICIHNYPLNPHCITTKFPVEIFRLQRMVCFCYGMFLVFYIASEADKHNM